MNDTNGPQIESWKLEVISKFFNEKNTSDESEEFNCTSVEAYSENTGEGKVVEKSDHELLVGEDPKHDVCNSMVEPPKVNLLGNKGGKERSETNTLKSFTENENVVMNEKDEKRVPNDNNENAVINENEEERVPNNNKSFDLECFDVRYKNGGKFKLDRIDPESKTVTKDSNVKMTSEVLGVHNGETFETVPQRNCVTVLVIWEKDNFFKKMGGKKGESGRLLAGFFRSVSSLANSLSEHCSVQEFEGTLSNQARRDFVFRGEQQARLFNCRLNEQGGIKSSLPRGKARVAISLHSEEDLGLGCEPLLTEQDLLFLVTFQQSEHLFRHFVTCWPEQVGRAVRVRFNSLSDVNLFLFNKSRSIKERTLGALRKGVGQHELVPDQKGFYRLVTFVTDIPVEFQSEFNFTVRPVEKGEIGERKEGGTFLLFKTKLEMLSFFTSEVSKGLRTLYFDENLIYENEVEFLKRELKKKESELKQARCIAEKLQLRSNRQSRIISRKDQNIVDMKEVIRNLSSRVEAKKSPLSDVYLNTEDQSDDEEQPLDLSLCPRLSLQELLSLRWKGETDSSSNYSACLVSFLQSPAILQVVEEEEEVRLVFKDQRGLNRLCTMLCKAGGGAQRAGLVPDPQHQDYGLLVYLEETSLLDKSIRQVETELRDGGGITEVWRHGFKTRFPDRLSFLRCLTNRELHTFHRVVIQDDNICFAGGSDLQPTFNGRPCLPEDRLLSLAWTEDDLAGVARGLTCLVRDPRVERKWLDWEGRLVLTFKSQEDLENVLGERGLGRRFRLTGRYILTCPVRTDVRDFFKVTDLCQMEEWGGMVFQSKLDLVRCLRDKELKQLYPEVELHQDCFEKSFNK